MVSYVCTSAKQTDRSNAGVRLCVRKRGSILPYLGRRILSCSLESCAKRFHNTGLLFLDV